MRKMTNEEFIVGRVFQHNLEVKQVKNKDSENFGKNYIAGTLDIATDDDCLNVVQIRYSYVTPTTKAGKANLTYTALNEVINANATVLKVGKDAATKVSATTSLGLNEFYDTKSKTMVSNKVNEGGFLSIINELPEDDWMKRNKFKVDMYINKVEHIDADPEKGINEPYAAIRGCVFSFKGDILPVELKIKHPGGMKYFEDYGVTAANPLLTCVWGPIKSETIKKEITEESAFGENTVRVIERKNKEWLITNAAKVPYDFGDENVLTMDEMQKASQNREVHLAELKKNAEDYQANKAESNAAFSTPITTNAADFKF